MVPADHRCRQAAGRVADVVEGAAFRHVTNPPDAQIDPIAGALEYRTRVPRRIAGFSRPQTATSMSTPAPTIPQGAR